MRSFPALLTLGLLCAAAAPARADGHGEGMAAIAGGHFMPMFRNGRGTVHVETFWMDRLPVTRGEYLDFVTEHQRWRRSRASHALAGESYLAGWRGDLDPGPAEELERPATEVSWFAARAYCEAQGKRLPTTDEWEYAARASETQVDATREAGFSSRLLALYTSRAGQAGTVGSTFRNVYGVSGLHGLGWEWTEDFNSLLISDDSRATSGRDHGLFCAAGVIGATDPSNYPAYLRYGVRAALTGRTTTRSLGFRCAQ